jgi:hypothetical protein
LLFLLIGVPVALLYHSLAFQMHCQHLNQVEEAG